MVADTAGITHATRRYDNVETREFFDRLALVHSLRKSQMWRLEHGRKIDIPTELRGVLAENVRGANGQRRIEKDRRLRNLVPLHQIDEVDDQLLGALNRKGGNQ